MEYRVTRDPAYQGTIDPTFDDVKHWKYIKREKGKGGKWKYYYETKEKLKKAEKNAEELKQEFLEEDSKADGYKLTEELRNEPLKDTISMTKFMKKCRSGIVERGTEDPESIDKYKDDVKRYNLRLPELEKAYEEYTKAKSEHEKAKMAVSTNITSKAVIGRLYADSKNPSKPDKNEEDPNAMTRKNVEKLVEKHMKKVEEERRKVEEERRNEPATDEDIDWLYKANLDFYFNNSDIPLNKLAFWDAQQQAMTRTYKEVKDMHPKTKQIIDKIIKAAGNYKLTGKMSMARKEYQQKNNKR